MRGVKYWIIWLVLALAGPLLAGCSALRLSYNQAPVLAYWWLDRYVDFSTEQSPRVKAALEDWLAWHRASQLPDYAQALAAMQLLAVDKVTASQVCGMVQAWQQRGERAFEHAIPALADLVRTLSPEQIKQIERQQAKKQREAVDDYLQPVLAERQKASFERALDRAETLYGKLDEPQRKRLALDLSASPFNPERWLAERRQRQLAIVDSLHQWQAERSDTATLQAGLRRLAAEPLRSPRADYQAYANGLMDANCTLMAGLHNSTSPAQRQHAVNKLKGWQGDLRALTAR